MKERYIWKYFFSLTKTEKFKVSNTCVRLVQQQGYKLQYVGNTVFGLWLYRKCIYGKPVFI